ncbi:MAG: hypothetical protein O0X96_05860, partial [Methanocorpusculum sp.]|nr:hypothetical protein [Methanocorpusculum sp.]
HQQLPEKIPAKYLHSINTQVLSVLFRKRSGIPCFFSVEFRIFRVFRGYSKRNHTQKNPNTTSPMDTQSETKAKKNPDTRFRQAPRQRCVLFG